MAAIFQHSPTMIVTRRDSGLYTPQSLKGKRIMLTPATDPESMAMLVEEGIPLGSLTILPHSWGLSDLIAGRVDGQTAYSTNKPYLLQKAGIEFATIQPLNYGIDFYGDCRKFEKQPFYHGETEYYVTASIGIAVAPEDGSDAVTLVKNADIAMYRAKSLGRNNYQFFAPALDIQAHNRVSRESKLRKALEHHELELFYQPLVHITSGEIIAAEALIRWRHEGQLIPPSEFISLAEDSGLILPLGEWVLNETARQAKKFQEAGYLLGISINISFRQFIGQDLVALLEKALAATNLAPGRLYFEITESMVMGDLANAQRIMGALQQLGIKFYLDDFGTGYSSLSHLKRLPIDGLKIDGSFIRDIVENTESKAITKAIVSLAQALNLTIVAEGVESDEQLRELCHINGLNTMLIQGYLVSRPVPAEQLELLLQQGKFTWNPPNV